MKKLYLYVNAIVVLCIALPGDISPSRKNALNTRSAGLAKSTQSLGMSEFDGCEPIRVGQGSEEIAFTTFPAGVALWATAKDKTQKNKIACPTCRESD